MCSTPAPPLTALVAASIWSGVGEVNTSPGQAASSMPMPTKPPCIGSCPEPPPDTRPTLPATGASARTITFGSVITRTRSACAAATPCSASLTTSAGSLISFFILGPLLGLALASGRSGRQDGPPGRRAAPPRWPVSGRRSDGLAGGVLRARPADRDFLRNAFLLPLQPRVQDVADEEVIDEHADDAADERADDRYPEVVAEVEARHVVAPGKGHLSPPREEGEQARPEVAGRVDGVAGVGAEGHADRCHGEADDQR